MRALRRSRGWRRKNAATVSMTTRRCPLENSYLSIYPTPDPDLHILLLLASLQSFIISHILRHICRNVEFVRVWVGVVVLLELLDRSRADLEVLPGVQLGLIFLVCILLALGCWLRWRVGFFLRFTSCCCSLLGAAFDCGLLVTWSFAAARHAELGLVLRSVLDTDSPVSSSRMRACTSAVGGSGVALEAIRKVGTRNRTRDRTFDFDHFGTI